MIYSDNIISIYQDTCRISFFFKEMPCISIVHWGCMKLFGAIRICEKKNLFLINTRIEFVFSNN